MYTNYRHYKEPEINTQNTSSMATWNTGMLGYETMAREQEKLVAPIQLAPVSKEQSLKEILRKYQESQYYNYSVFLSDLEQLGYITEPIQTPVIHEIKQMPPGHSIKANFTYGDYKHGMKRTNDTFNGDDGYSSKKAKINDGWGDESGNLTANKSATSNSGWSDEEGGKSTTNNNKQQQQRPIQSQGGWDDDKGKRPRKNFDHRKSSNPASRMQTGWSDEENDQSRNQDRFGENRSYNNNRYNGNNDRYEGNNDRGSRGRGRGGRGRGNRGNWNGNRHDNNDRYNNNNNSNNNESAAASGWSDDESKATTKSAVDKKIITKTDAIDDWDNPEPIIQRDSSADKSLTTVTSTKSNVDDGWDE